MYSIKMRASNQQIHISGAETICEFENLEKTIKKYFNKGFYHENGSIDFLNLKIEKITKPIQNLEPLTIIQNQNASMEDLANNSGVSDKALKNGFKYIENDISYTGAIVLSAKTGERLDSTENRGIRVTNFAFKDRNKINDISERVKDALSIATCINSFNNVKGELCVSDDLNYTTGYYASPTLGYNRIFNIKKKNTRQGGRIIFVDEKIDLNNYIVFLEETPKQIIY
ncbi:6-carboxyhexanoate--CoA ligase [Staphylococcus saprophyticus]|nr:6-carboxyhexanoate--CoA ligase [Staphylococcus saprophyticus]MDW4159963.1 6-carboxyhexanoate--CoA ligase [Staphylococcus saprophyticus]MDW4162404.1 6-carboxyhexanoate--CoA ligase [Staphylococcus saprophyticus]